MQPSSGGFWQPNDADDAQDNEQKIVSQDAQSAGFSSAYDGYELTQPEQKPTTQPAASEVQWEASEYIQHDKDMSWFIILFAAALILFGVALFFRQWTFAALIIAMTASIIVYARRPPRTLHYRLSLKDFTIEGKPYHYTDYKAFGVTKDGPLHMITLLPRKRFAPPVSMYFEEQDGEMIVDILGTHMPMQQLKHDMFDDFVRKLRF